MTHLVALLLLAQSTGSISGTVVDFVTGAPIRRAHVHLNGNLAVTDAAGSFLFDQTPPGAYAIDAQHPDYPRVSSSTAVTLAPGEQKQGLELKLTPAASIMGHISDADGDPLACNLTLVSRIGKSIALHSMVTSDRNGDYTFPFLSPGKYYVEAQCPPPQLQPRPYALPHAALSGPRLGYAYRFYPGTSSFSGAQRLTVTPGQTLRGIDFRMSPQTVSDVVVHVKGLAPKTAVQAIASLTLDDGSPNWPNNARFAQLQPTGMASIAGVPPGKYILRIATLDEQMLFAKQPVEVGEQAIEVTVQAAPLLQLTGTLHADKPTDLQAAVIWLLHMDESNVRQLRVNPGDTFSFSSLAPGRYLITTPGDLYVQSIEAKGQTFDGAEFELKPGANEHIDVHLSMEKGTVSGDVDLGSSHPARIKIFATTPTAQFEVFELPVGQPRYKCQLQPGHYRLYATEYTAGQDPLEFLNDASLAARGESVDIVAGSTVVKTLKLTTAEEIEKADP